MKQTILIFVEQRDGLIPSVCLELIRGAGQLVRQSGGFVTALLPGFHVQKTAEQLAEAGADEVVTIDEPFLARYAADPFTNTVFEAVGSLKPDIVLFGATPIGLELASRTAARLNTCLITDCTGLALDPDSGLLLMTRPDSDGTSADTFVIKTSRPQIASVRSGVLDSPSRLPQAAGGAAKKAVLRSLDKKLLPVHDKITLLSSEKNQTTAPDITKARILVAGGRGVGGPEGLTLLKTLARLLGGEIACSRACVEAGWLDDAFQVGQSGKTVHPDLYVACGISGAFQHTAGMDHSKFIIAINKNSAAPIFDIADLCIVGDLKDILPRLIEALEIR